MHSEAPESGLCRLILDRLSLGVALVDGAGGVITANDAFWTLAGIRPADATIAVLSERFDPDDALREAASTAMKDGRARVVLRDPESETPLEVTLRSCETPSGRVLLTEWRRADAEAASARALRESEERFRTLQHNLPVGIYRTGEDGIIQTANPALMAMVGYSSFEELNEAALDHVWVDPSNRTELIRRLRTEGAVLGHTVHLRRKDGKEFIGSLDARGTFDSDGRLQYFDAIVQDITERVHARQELEHLARTDGLTGLFNRQHLMERLTAELVRGKRYDHPLSLLILDLDHFKAINDTYGHLVGDRVLRTVADVITNSIRLTDTAGRYGGEEFCVVLPETDLRGARLMAERIREAVECLSMHLQDRTPLQLTCSIGLAQACSADSDKLIAHADEALYEAKRAGRNRVVSAQSAPSQ